MSLKAFHIVFIAACLVLGLGLAVWGSVDWRETREASSLVMAIAGFLLALLSIPYSYWFVRKLKKVSYL